MQEHMRLDSVVCLCDSPRLLRTLIPPSASGENATSIGAQAVVVTADALAQSSTDASASLVMSQLALSDRVLLNKSDLMTPDEVSISFDRLKVAMHVPPVADPS